MLLQPVVVKRAEQKAKLCWTVCFPSLTYGHKLLVVTHITFLQGVSGLPSDMSDMSSRYPLFEVFWACPTRRRSQGNVNVSEEEEAVAEGRSVSSSLLRLPPVTTS